MTASCWSIWRGWNMTQLDLLCREPRTGTQHHKLLLAFQRGESLTVGVALEKYGVYALSQRVGELKKMGWPIESETIETDGGAHVSRYWMVNHYSFSGDAAEVE